MKYYHRVRIAKVRKQTRNNRIRQATNAALAVLLLSFVALAPISDSSAATKCIGDGSYNCTYEGYSANTQTWADKYYYAGEHNCTRYAAFRLAKREVPDQGSWGNAYEWDTNAKADGYAVNNTPAVGAIAQWDGGSGHVAHVDAAGSDWIEFSDDAWGGVTRKGMKAKKDGSGDKPWPDNFIHVKDLTQGAATPGVVRKFEGALQWHLRDSNSGGGANLTFKYGLDTDKPITGDWDGDGDATVGVVRAEGSGWRWLLNNSNTPGSADKSFIYGKTSDVPIAGDWDGNGTVTPGVIRKNNGSWQWHLRNSNNGGGANMVFSFGVASSDYPVVGDWDGNGTTTIGIYRRDGAGWHWYIRNANSAGAASANFVYGLYDTDQPIVGDWDGDGSTTPGVVRPDGGGLHWYLRNTNSGGAASINFIYGLASKDTAIAGDWDGQ